MQDLTINGLQGKQPAAQINPFAGVDFSELEKSLRRPRTLISLFSSGLVAAMTLVALIPLFSVVWMLAWHGGQKLSLAVFTQLPPAPLEEGGGFGNAILGTLVMVAMAALISVPFGILSAVFLAETARKAGLPTLSGSRQRCLQASRRSSRVSSPTARLSSSWEDIRPSRARWPSLSSCCRRSSSPRRTLSAWCPAKMREAADRHGRDDHADGVDGSPATAMPGILTGIMLAIARAAGETAPLLFTALFSNYWFFGGGEVDLIQPTASLAVLIYNFASMPFENQVALAWAAALVLVLLVLVTNLIGQAFSRRQVHQ